MGTGDVFPLEFPSGSEPGFSSGTATVIVVSGSSISMPVTGTEATYFTIAHSASVIANTPQPDFSFTVASNSLSGGAIYQFNQGTKISAAEARPGDLVVTDGTKGYATHAGIYIGEDIYGKRLMVSELPDDGTENSGKCVITHLTDAFEYRRVGNNTCTLCGRQATSEVVKHLESIGIFGAFCYGDKDENGRLFFFIVNAVGDTETVYFDDPSRQACIEYMKQEYLMYEKGERFW